MRALVAIAALTGPQAEPAFACSCAYLNLARDVPRADAAFAGTVLSHRVDRPNAPRWVFLTFAVERAVKGSLPSPLTVKTSAQESACGLGLHDGDRIGLLLDRRGGDYFSGLCSAVYPAHLVRYVQPQARVIAAPPEGSAWPWWLAGAAGGVLIVLAAGAVAYRRLYSATSGRRR